jgi:hypothetical protein
MADVATPSAAAMFDASTEKKKPEKPDEELYKANLKKAEKEHADAKAKFVSLLTSTSHGKYPSFTCIWHVWQGMLR